MAFTKEELKELAEYDKLVEKGIDLYPLDKEKEKASKDARKTHSGTYKFTKRERKPNLTKQEIISTLSEFLIERVENLEILNKERQISFKLGENTYELTLTQKRKSKD